MIVIINMPMGKNNKNTLRTNLFIIFAIVALVYVLSSCGESQENLCMCAGARTRLCADRCNLRKAYFEKNMTEYSDLAKVQKEMGGPFWSTYSPGDYQFQEKKGNCCGKCRGGYGYK